MYSILSGIENKETHEHIPTEGGFESGRLIITKLCVLGTNEQLYLDLFVVFFNLHVNSGIEGIGHRAPGFLRLFMNFGTQPMG